MAALACRRRAFRRQAAGSDPALWAAWPPARRWVPAWLPAKRWPTGWVRACTVTAVRPARGATIKPVTTIWAARILAYPTVPPGTTAVHPPMRVTGAPAAETAGATTGADPGPSD